MTCTHACSPMRMVHLFDEAVQQGEGGVQHTCMQPAHTIAERSTSGIGCAGTSVAPKRARRTALADALSDSYAATKSHLDPPSDSPKISMKGHVCSITVSSARSPSWSSFDEADDDNDADNDGDDDSDEGVPLLLRSSHLRV